MNILLFGTTGRVGSEIVRYALQDGQHVTAFVRSSQKLALQHERLTVIEGNVLHKEAVMKAIASVDVVVSALNYDGAKTLSTSMPYIIEAMIQHGVKRIVTVGTAGILQSCIEPEKLRYQSSESKRKVTLPAEDHHAAYAQLAASTLDWTIVCPTYLPDGENTGTYRVEQHVLPEDGNRITVGDTAHFTYAQVTSNTYNRMRVGIAY